MIVDKLVGNNTVMELENGNRIIIGDDCLFSNTRVQFVGSNNILKMEGRCHVTNSVIEFCGSESLAVFSSNWHSYYLNLSLNNNNVFYVGKNHYFNPYGERLRVILSEQKHVFFGCNGGNSFGVCLRTADAHLIYDIASKQRINPSRSIFIGDHVWIGQGAWILKGTQIGSGSIIGAGSVVANKKIPSNTSWAGNPARQIKKGIFWSGECVHKWTDKETQQFQIMQKDDYVFDNKQEEGYLFDLLDRELSTLKTAHEKNEYLSNREYVNL